MKRIMITLIGLTIVGALNAVIVDLPVNIKAVTVADYSPHGECNLECDKNPNTSECKECMKRRNMVS